MTTVMTLQHRLAESAARHGGRCAVEDPATGRAISYAELNRLTGRLRDRLVALGVGPGDRVGFYLRKSIDSIATLYGVLEAGAAYVPVDAGAPAARNAFILTDCAVKVVVAEERFAPALAAEIEKLAAPPPAILRLGEGDARLPLAAALDALDAANGSPPATRLHPSAARDLAYILYTSGSTGKPKGVMLTQENALSFVDWCSEVFAPTAEDRFSSHAPLHFDLSILDVHVSLKHGATLVLIGEEVGKEPLGLAQLIAERRISIWYSAPSILGLLAQYGKLERYDFGALRLVLFAGEVFPVKHLRALQQCWPGRRYVNLYGPTETNVCTSYEVPAAVPEKRAQPYPIGRICSHLEGLVIDEAGQPVARGEEGELVVSGPGVTQGYWNLPERNAVAFHRSADGRAWYRTGDLVVEDEAGDWVFLGRRDRMIKKRGYRIELGEIEACLYQHPLIREAGVIAAADGDGNVLVRAFLGTLGGERPSIIALKAFCAERLPLYMVPDRFSIHERLPRTSTAKVDYQALQRLA